MAAKSLNQINLIGNMCDDIRVSKLNDTVVGRFAMKVDRGYLGQDGSCSDVFQCSIWNEYLIKKAQQYLRRGRKIFVSGAIRMMMKKGYLLPDLRIKEFYMLDDKYPNAASQDLAKKAVIKNEN
jgi:hypothetical protein